MGFNSAFKGLKWYHEIMKLTEHAQFTKSLPNTLSMRSSQSHSLTH